MRVIVEICNSLTSKSYFQLMNSLKTEFRRGSTKLVSTDRLQYFHLVWFLTSYHRMKIQALKSHYKHLVKAHEKKKEELLAAMDFDSPQPPEPKKPDYEEKAVLATLDMFSFNFVLQSVENFASVKNYHGMTVSVQLLTEMMSYIAEMASSDDVRFQRIADSLQHKIFYERDFLDRLPVLLKTWTPGSFSHDYVTDVVTLTHVSTANRGMSVCLGI
jgi:timeless